MKKRICIFFSVSILNLYSLCCAQDWELNAFKDINRISIKVESLKGEGSLGRATIDVDEDIIKKAIFVMLKTKTPSLQIEDDFLLPYLEVRIFTMDLKKLLPEAPIKGFIGTISFSLNRLVLLPDCNTPIIGAIVWSQNYSFYGPENPADHIKGRILDDLLNEFAFKYFKAKELTKGKTK